MKIITILIASLFIVSSRNFDSHQEFQMHQLFQNWKQKHNKYYSQYEEVYRFQAFQNNYQAIQLHNSNPNQSYTMSLNAFSDLSNLEFQNLYLNNQYDSINNADFNSIGNQEDEYQNQMLLTGIDWRGITEVKDQGSCGAGWAFSVVAAVEAYQIIQSGKSVLLSEQELIDCQTLNDGCQGGTNVLGLKYVKENGLTTSEAYPYIGMKNTQCKISSGNYKLSSYVYVGTNEAELKKALTSHPVSAGVDATNWQSYEKGVFDNCTKTINHYILVVGYEDTGNWIIKNSWGTSWGDSGHIKLSSGNTCGILDAAYQNS